MTVGAEAAYGGFSSSPRQGGPPARTDPEGDEDSGFQVDHHSVRLAGHGVDSLRSRVTDMQRVAKAASDSLDHFLPWGCLGEIFLRGKCISLMQAFHLHLDHMGKALGGAAERLGDTAHRYSETELAILQVLSAAGENTAGREGVRQLNWVSQFYQKHTNLYWGINYLPPPLGALGASGLNSARFVSDLRSDDKFNTSTDLAALTSSLVTAGFGFFSAKTAVRLNPLGYLTAFGLTFLLNYFQWTKRAADLVTGDPMRTGQAAYNYDSLAKSCHRLAQDLGTTLNRFLGNGAWRGKAAEAASKRLEALRDGIAETGRRADDVAAMLQLTSAIIGSVEGIVRAAINEVITWAVLTWMAASLLAAETGGVSEAAAIPKIAQRSAETATWVGRLIRLVGDAFRRIGALMQKLAVSFKSGYRRAFAALLNSSWGKKNMEFINGSRYVGDVIRKDAVGRGRHATITKIRAGHVAVSWVKQARRSSLNTVLSEWGLSRYLQDKSGKMLAKQQLRPHSYTIATKKGTRYVRNYAGMPVATVLFAGPFARGWQYAHRSGSVESDGRIDDKLDLWSAPS
ncbi:hypothetical protein GCM10023191_047600 [Actinoallomurus oryzae]|jgi:hypothetical protein|uniref:Uncharacterized protein n=1 Tax=Actinoallomurus oryzae TaxID=502180 RepID=A0ABP8QD00_9ACTN